MALGSDPIPQLAVADLSAFEKFKLFVEPLGTLVLNIVVTFVETALGVLAASFTSGQPINKLAVGVACGVAASTVWNTVIKPFAKKNGYIKV